MKSSALAMGGLLRSLLVIVEHLYVKLSHFTAGFRVGGFHLHDRETIADRLAVCDAITNDTGGETEVLEIAQDFYCPRQSPSQTDWSIHG